MGHHSCYDKKKVNKGLWSPEEDEKLINYISNYGHGCWSSVPKFASNIITAPSWAQIAKQLPGRTDNEVNNFWNTSIRKKLISYDVPAIATFPDVHFNGNSEEEQTNYVANLVQYPPPMAPPSNSSSYDSLWSLGYLPHKNFDPNQEHQNFISSGATQHYIGDKLIGPSIATPNYDEDPLIVPMIPNPCEIINGNLCGMSYSCASLELDPLARLPYFPVGCDYPYDPHMPNNHME
ncbi:transcription factor myb26 [Quercus suber]|uniref:Transcription factor myb26 n=1 Tax=Quercus suber TaxID=58331 RepID=A0AAW0JH04_QUESU